MKTGTASQQPTRARTITEVFEVFLKLGLTCFGGPVAHLAYVRREFVERRGWLGDETFTDLVGLCQFLPGPASSQMGFWIGLLRAEWLGIALCRKKIPADTIRVLQQTSEIRVSRTVSAVALASFCVLLLSLPTLVGLHAGRQVMVFEAFYRSGALVFGGGHVVLPLLQQQTVATGWVSPNDFLAGYGPHRRSRALCSHSQLFLAGWPQI